MIFDETQLTPNACYSCGKVLDGGYTIGADRRRRCIWCSAVAQRIIDSHREHDACTHAVERFAAVLVLRQRQLIRQRAGREG